MALEAARQMAHSTASNAVSASLHDICFDDPLPLDHFRTPSTAIEMHLNARRSEEMDVFEFDIFSKSNQQPSLRRCHGMFSWSLCASQPPARAPIDRSDPFLLKSARAVVRASRQPDFLKLSDLALCEEGACGTFADGQEYCENYCVDPVALSSILTLIPMPGVRRNLPASQRLVFIKAVSSPLGQSQTLSGSFHATYRPLEPYRGQCNVELSLGDTTLVLSEVLYEAERLVHLQPPLESLLFKPVLMPDITKLETTTSMPFEGLMRFVTHKWPMSDVGFAGLPVELFKSLSDDLASRVPGRRRQIRSLTLLDDLQKNMAFKTQQANASIVSRFHLLILGEIHNLLDMVKYMQSDGLACVCASTLQDVVNLEPLLERICPVQGISDDTWSLWRLRGESDCQPDKQHVVTFTSERDKVFLPDVFKTAESVTLEPSVASQYVRTANKQRMDAVVIDTPRTAVLTKWPGSKLIPWLRTLLKSSRSLLWVTIDNFGSVFGAETPFTNVAGSLLRTLQAEQPSLKVGWVRLHQAGLLSEPTIQGHIASAYNAMLKGDNEVLREVKNDCINVLRYIPDDELSAATGAIPPQPIPGLDTNRSYEVSLATANTPVILTHYLQRGESVSSEESLVKVQVAASVIYPSEAAAYSGYRYSSHYTNWSNQDSCHTSDVRGMFFAGCVLSETNKAFPKGSRVVGWQPGAHTDRLHVSSKQLQVYNKGRDPLLSATKAATRFGALATAIGIVDGIARIRQNDTLRIKCDGILREAVIRECEKAGATILDADETKVADFTVTIDSLGDVCVNRKRIDLVSYLESDHGHFAISQAWTACTPYEADVHVHTLTDLTGAFYDSEKNPCSTVLVHQDHDKASSSVPIYRRPSKLFSRVGAYVIIGGLGGLGRFVCSWMVENGAKTIYAISRSGLRSTEAQEAYAAIINSGASLEVLKADACDQKAMTEVLGQIREKHSIIGVVNMAMLLGDAPFMDMTVRSAKD